MIKVDKLVKDNSVDLVSKLKNDPLLSIYEINDDNALDFLNYKNACENCKKCSGINNCINNSNGFAPYINIVDGKYYFEQRKCRYKAELMKKTNQSGLLKSLYMPKKVLDARLENFNITNPSREKAYKYVCDFIENFGSSYKEGLYLYGNYQRGKTYLLSCVANKLADKGVETLIIYVPDLIRDLKNMIGTPKLEETINMLKEIPVLFLDDFGAELMTPWVRDEVISPVMNYRMMDEKPVFISSNLSPQKLLEHLKDTKLEEDEAKADRILKRIQGLSVMLFFE